MKITKRRLSLKDIEKELARFEAKYTMPSEEFYTKFNRGEMGDERDFFKWASLFEWASLCDDNSA